MLFLYDNILLKFVLRKAYKRIFYSETHSTVLNKCIMSHLDCILATYFHESFNVICKEIDTSYKIAPKQIIVSNMFTYIYI